MTILDSPPPDWKRPNMGLGIKLDAMMRRYGKHAFHHAPGTWERKFDTETNDTIPPANDPKFIEAVTIVEHDVIENGPGGEKRITSAGSATNRRAKRKRIADEPEKWRQILGPKSEAPEPQSRWPKGRKLRSRTRICGTRRSGPQ